MKRFAIVILMAVMVCGLLGATAYHMRNVTGFNLGVLNATGATGYAIINDVFDRGYVKFSGVNGSGARTYTIQVSDTLPPGVDAVFTNATASHTLTPGDVDTYKLDFQLRGGNVIRVYCVSGCDITNSVDLVYGRVWNVGGRMTPPNQ